MKMMTLSIAAVCAASVGPALAATPMAPAPAVIEVAQNDDSASQQARYEAQAREEMALWQRRMEVAGARTQVELGRAWSATKEQWAVLQHATADGWDRSRAAFERATERMKAEWDKYRQNG